MVGSPGGFDAPEDEMGKPKKTLRPRPTESEPTENLKEKPKKTLWPRPTESKPRKHLWGTQGKVKNEPKPGEA